MIAAEIALALGCAHRSGGWWRCRCPVHRSRGPTLALRDGDRGLIAVCHARCSRADILGELRRQGLIEGDFSASPPRPIPRGTDSGDDGTRRIQLARRIWDSARVASGSTVAAYLTARGVTIGIPSVLRYAPSLRRPDGSSGPAMVARVDDVDGRLIGVHRTWLTRDPNGQWKRRDRASLGPIRGGAVRLAPAADTLMVAEGIETAMAATTATAMPAWAALSTSGMVTLALPSIVRTVIILADHDVNGAGERAARIAAARWLAERRRVQIALPPEPGTDIADLLNGQAFARLTEARHDAA
jgi:putative DNA primase/helicase